MTAVKKKYVIFGKELTGENVISMLGGVLLLAMIFSYILRGFMGIYYHEIDSYVLPSISMQYRHSLFITQDDIDRAKIDYPDYYEDVDDFDSLRSSQLVEAGENKWLAYYFPFYTMLCMPMKLIIQLIGANQIRAFTVTNALFVIFALIYLYRKLNVSLIYKQLAILLFIISPIYMYIEYISSEAVMFSLITIALVMYSNKQYRSAAFVLSAASMPNPTVMGIGIVMVAEYLIKMFLNRKNVRIFSLKNISDTVKYACCYIPCLIPFIFNFFAIGSGNPTSSGLTLVDYGARVLTYFFDVNFGFFSFAPVTLVTFIVLTAVLIKRKDFSAIVYAGFLVFPVLAYSLMIYINCIPTFCARYVMWTYPALFIGTVLAMDKIVTGSIFKYASGAVLTAAAAAMISINSIPMYYYGFNGMTTFLLENFPAVYSPYRAMFYGMNDKLHWVYELECPSYYFSKKDGSIIKVLFKAAGNYKEDVMSMLNGSEESLNRFSDMIDKIPSDGKFHYINISPFKNIELKEKTSEDKGLMAENEVILQMNDSFILNNSEKEFDVGILPGVIYKLELEFDEGFMPADEDDFYAQADIYRHKLIDFTHTDKNKYTIIFAINNDKSPYVNKIVFASIEKVKINSFKLTSMISTSPTMISEEPVMISGGEQEGSVLYPAPLEPMSYYVVDIVISDEEKLSEDDALYCTVEYEKRFNSYKFYDFKITGQRNRFYIFPWDTTVALGPTYIKIHGKTAEEIEIESVTLELAQ